MATKAEVQARLDHILDWLSKGHTKGEIKQKCREKFGTSYRTFERDMGKCRELIISEIDKPRSELIAESIAYYRRFLTDPKTSREFIGLKARERMDKVLGLESPTKFEHSGPDGQPIKTQVIDPEKATQIASDPVLAGHAQALGVNLGLPTGQVNEGSGE